jgi:ribosome-associated heat shock protein Hsp15
MDESARVPDAIAAAPNRRIVNPSGDDGHRQERSRIDKWLWAARFFKTRSLAAQAVEGGKVKLNDERVKAAKALRVGDRLAIQLGACEWIVTVIELSDRRGPAPIARTLYEEDPQARAARLAALDKRRGVVDPQPLAGGRPEKKQRRDLQRLRGY